MLFVNPSKIRLLGRDYSLPTWVPTQVLFYFLFLEDPSSDSSFPLFFSFRLKFRIPIRTSFWIQCSYWNQSLRQKFEFFNSIFSFGRSEFRLRFSPFFIFRLKFRVPTRTSFWSRCSHWTNCLRREFEFSNSILIHSFILKNRVLTWIFPSVYSYFWSFELRLRLPFGPNVRIGPIARSRIRVLKLDSHSLLLFLKNRVPTRIFPFVYFVSEVSGSDSDFLLDPMLVLEPIVASRIHVLKLNSHSFFHVEKPGSDSDFRFCIFLFSRVPTRIFPSDPMLVLDLILLAFPFQVKG